MAIKELDIDEDHGYISIRRSTYYALIAVIITLIVVSAAGGLVGYASVNSPKTFCSYVVKHNIGDQDAQDGCHYKLAKEYNNIEYCNGIINNNLQRECVRILSGDFNY